MAGLRVRSRELYWFWSRTIFLFLAQDIYPEIWEIAFLRSVHPKREAVQIDSNEAPKSRPLDPSSTRGCCSLRLNVRQPRTSLVLIPECVMMIHLNIRSRTARHRLSSHSHGGKGWDFKSFVVLWTFYKSCEQPYGFTATRSLTLWCSLLFQRSYNQPRVPTFRPQNSYTSVDLTILRTAMVYDYKGCCSSWHIGTRRINFGMSDWYVAWLFEGARRFPYA